MKKHRYLWLTLALVSILVTGACGGQPAPAEMPDMGTIQVGYIPILAYAPIFVAIEKGYFEEQGLEVELQGFRSGSVMIALLSTGKLDVGAGETGPALFNAIHQELDIKVVASLLSQPPGYGTIPCLVRKDLFDSGEIAEPADFAGRKVSVNIERGMNEYLWSEVLGRAGLTVDDVELVTLPFPDIPAALANQAIDGAILPQPLAGKAIGEGSAVVFIGGDEITDTPQNAVVYFGQRFLDPANKEAAVRFLVAYLKGARDIYGEAYKSDEHVAIFSQYTNIPEETIKKVPPFYTDPNGEINRDSTEKVHAYHVGRGYLEFSEPLSLDQVIDESFLEEALTRLGQFEE